MNKLEAHYNQLLTLDPLVLRHTYEGIKLRLARATFYTPDFLVVYADRIELHEVKGHWEDDARVKWKTAAEMFPEFRFVAIQKIKGAFRREVYGEKQ